MENQLNVTKENCLENINKEKMLFFLWKRKQTKKNYRKYRNPIIPFCTKNALIYAMHSCCEDKKKTITKQQKYYKNINYTIKSRKYYYRNSKKKKQR